MSIGLISLIAVLSMMMMMMMMMMLMMMMKMMMIMMMMMIFLYFNGSGNTVQPGMFPGLDNWSDQGGGCSIVLLFLEKRSTSEH